MVPGPFCLINLTATRDSAFFRSFSLRPRTVEDMTFPNFPSVDVGTMGMDGLACHVGIWSTRAWRKSLWWMSLPVVCRLQTCATEFWVSENTDGTCLVGIHHLKLFPNTSAKHSSDESRAISATAICPLM